MRKTRQKRKRVSAAEFERRKGKCKKIIDGVECGGDLLVKDTEGLRKNCKCVKCNEYCYRTFSSYEDSM